MTKDQIIEQQKAIIEQQQKFIHLLQDMLSTKPAPVVVPYPAPYQNREFKYNPPWRDRIWVKNDNTAGGSTDGWQLTDGSMTYDYTVWLN